MLFLPFSARLVPDELISELMKFMDDVRKAIACHFRDEHGLDPDLGGED